MRHTALLLACTVAAAPIRAQQPVGVLSDSAIRTILQQHVDAQISAGIVVGVLDPDGRRRVFAHGASGTARPLDASSVFEIGSITKTFTGILLAEMAGRGEVRLDDPVAKYLPASVKVPSRNGRQITLLDLATHSSGLPRLPGNHRPKDLTDPYADYTPEQMYELLSSYELQRDIGAQFEYSNLGFMLLGHALARRAAATTYEEVLRRRVLDPLGLRDTRATPTPSMRERLALGHDESGAVVANWHIHPTLGGVGALLSTASDMLGFVAANLAADLDSTRGSLAPALRASHVWRHAGSGGGIGLAWNRRPLAGGDTIVWKNGGTGGYRTFVGYNPVRRTGVVVLTNSNAAGDETGFHLLAPELPLSLPAWASLKAITLPRAVLDRYVGEYALPPAGHFLVVREGDRLLLEPNGQSKRSLFAEKEDEFFLRGVDARITFQRDSAGRVTGLVLRQNGRDQVAPRVR